MGSGRALLFDYALVASLTVLLFAAAAAWFGSRRNDGLTADRWTPIVAGLGSVVLVAMFGSKLLDAVTGANSDVYPDQPVALIFAGMAATAAAAVAVYDSFSTRTRQVAKRLSSTGKLRLVAFPALLAIAVVALVGGLWKFDPRRDAPPQTTEPVAESTTTTAVPSRPATITMASSSTVEGGDGAPGPGLTLNAITEPGDLQLPTFLASPPADDRLFVLERLGRVRVIDVQGLRPEPLLDITDSVGSGIDGGLLGLAFHPDFADNGRMFIQYTDGNDDNRVVEYRVDPATATLSDDAPIEILYIEKPSSFHAGGMLQFGPDGYLYIAIGDGRDFGLSERRTERDLERVSQNPDNLLGAILRIDVDGGSPYVVPDANGFGGRQPNETFAFGLRNPYRFWIDPPSNQIFIGDPGAVTWEEIDVVDLDVPGINFGWDTTEGTRCYLLRSEFIGGCDRTGLTDPILAYRNFKARHPEVEADDRTGSACAVIFGAVYRGSDMPGLDGTAFYADYCSSWIGGFSYDDGQIADSLLWEPTADLTLGSPLSFGVDAKGELYLLTAAGGMIYRLGA